MQDTSLPVIEIEGKPYTAVCAVAYYDFVFFTLSFQFHSIVMDKLRGDMELSLAERKQFADVDALDKFFFNTCAQRIGAIASETKQYDHRLITCHILSDMEQVFLSAREVIACYFSDQSKWSKAAVDKVCFLSYMTLNKRKTTVAAFQHLIKRLRQRFPRYEVQEYWQI